jgi:alkylation response protein AidB-like acyl-CoA dehydrogenase
MPSQVSQVFADEVARGGLDLPFPGGGQTAERLDALVRLGRRDCVLARLGEGHVDALAILHELGGDGLIGPDQRWGVWAAVPGSITARATPTGWRLDGDRPWCSGAAACTEALVTAAAEDGPRLFAVRVGQPQLTPLDGTWPAIGMADSDSRTVRFVDVPAIAVGGPNDYVNRPGFWHGAIGVAACWYGGAIGVTAKLLWAARERELDAHAWAHLGAVDAVLAEAGALLARAAAKIDAKPAEHQPRLARQVRAAVETCALEVLDRVGRALGAGPLCQDAEHAKRVADLTVYLRQSHAERDLAELGRLAAAEDLAW